MWERISVMWLGLDEKVVTRDFLARFAIEYVP
jgi:hypothetical protein